MSEVKKICIESNIECVTAFLSGAEITRRGKTALKQGNYDIVFDNLPLELKSDSISVKGKGAFTILSVSREFTGNSAETNERIIEIRKKIEKIDKELIKEQSLLEVWKMEEDLLVNNLSIKGEETLTAGTLKEMADFYRARFTEVKDKTDKSKEIIKNLTEERNLLGNEAAVRPPQKSQIIVNIAVHADISAEIEISYFVISAGWTPSYDIRVESIDKPVTLNYKAAVWQTTAEDWNNIRLILSTGNPVLSGAHPIMEPYWLHFDNPRATKMKQAPAYNMAFQARSLMLAEALPASASIEDAASPDSAIKEKSTNIEFELDVNYTILSGKKAKTVDIKTKTIEAEYEYYSARKLEKAVFLLAKLYNWESLNLLEAEASIFYEDKFVCTSYINPRLADKYIEVSLGRDTNIIVTRVKGKDFSAKSFGNIKATREWQLNVKNLKQQKIKLILLDQIPVSNDKKIVVEAISISDAELNKDRGILTWKLELPPAAQKSFTVKYQVTYPEGTIINLE